MSIIFKQLMITDMSNKLSKKIIFSEGVNLITSDKNSRGKSVVMKSLYHSLGANSDFDDIFTKDNVLFDLQLEHNGNLFRVCRFKDSYRVFKNHELIKTVKKGNINELSLFFKEEIDTYVYLKNREKTTELAPPAFLFIPYYLDQDLSWKREQFPFNNIGQYENLSRNELYYYHLGVFTDEYNQNKSRQFSIKKEIDEIEKKAEKENAVFSELKKILGNEVIAINETEFQAVVSTYSIKMNSLLIELDKKRRIISTLEKEKIEYLIEERRISSTLKKIRENKFENIKKLECPVCKSEIEIDLEKELGVIYDEKILTLRLDSISKLVEEIEEKTLVENKQRTILQENIANYEKSIFENRKLLSEYFNRKATEELLQQKSVEATEHTYMVNQLKDALSILREKTREFRNKSDGVDKTFVENYKTELYALETPEFNSKLIKPFIKAKISGSQYVRSTLAFYYSFIKTKEDYGIQDFLFPMVIDSPREGEQDDLNSAIILDFIFKNKMPDYQLIVATVNADKYMTITDNIKLITLWSENRRVMNSMEYKENIDEINQMFSYFKKTDIRS